MSLVQNQVVSTADLTLVANATAETFTNARANQKGVPFVAIADAGGDAADVVVPGTLTLTTYPNTTKMLAAAALHTYYDVGQGAFVKALGYNLATLEGSTTFSDQALSTSASLIMAYNTSDAGAHALYSNYTDDNNVVPGDRGLLAVSVNTAYNGTNYDFVRSGSAANLSAAQQPFTMMTNRPADWSINHTPAANTQATITRAAGAAGVRHVCTSITASLIGLAASAEATVLVNLRDGATGAGTILWSTRLLVTGTTGSETGITLSGLNIIGTAATAMTLEFAAAGGASTFEAVAMTGYDVI